MSVVQGTRARGWIRNHDTLLFYAKGGRPATFHKEYIPYPPGYVRRDGKPPRGRGYPIEDVWNASDVDRMDSIQIMSFSGEKVGYPTQKNESLVSRIVRASSSPGDLVLDFCVGSGTTAVVAEKLGRRWIACDASPIAVHATRKRLMRLPQVRPLVVQHAGEGASGSAAGAKDGEAGEPARGAPRKLGARVAVDGRSATIELASFALPPRAVPLSARAAVAHWSQWIDGWCIDWDHRGGAMVTFATGSRVWAIACAGRPAALRDARVRRPGPLRGPREGLRRAGRGGSEAARSRSRMNRDPSRHDQANPGQARVSPPRRARLLLIMVAAPIVVAMGCTRAPLLTPIPPVTSATPGPSALPRPRRLPRSKRPRPALAPTPGTGSRPSRPRCSRSSVPSRCLRRSRAASSRSWTCARPGSARSAPTARRSSFPGASPGSGRSGGPTGPAVSRSR